jgi:hypothetical protein
MKLAATYVSRIIKKAKWMTFLLLAVVPAGCRVLPDKALSRPASEVISTGFAASPRIRFGCYPSATMGTFFLGPNLGRHGYYFQPGEKNGIAYTCQAGDIDVIHVRIGADWTAYLAAKTYKTLMSGKDGFSYKLAVDRSRNYISFSYPSNWDRMSQAEREAAAKDVAMALGPYLSFTMTTWHEILTWFGFRCIGLATEFPSAFSWEDSFSNLLGTVVAVRALQDTQHHYNEAIEIALDEEMKKLGVLPARVAREASQRVKGTWYTGSMLFFVDIKMRNFDVGLDDGRVTPTLLPNVTQCSGVTPLSYPVPTLDALARHGFAIKLQTRCREWERRKIFEILFGDRRDRRVEPIVHIPPLMAYIRQNAITQYGYMVEVSPQRLHARE